MSEEIKINGIYRHPADIEYGVDSIVFNATQYEETHELEPWVLYTQLKDGEVKPAGTQYVRTIPNFLDVFEYLKQSETEFPNVKAEMPEELVSEGIYKHSDGIEYRLEGIVFDVTGYEENHQIVPMVLYTQLKDGKVKPAGTQYVRTVDDFLNVFELVE